MYSAVRTDSVENVVFVGGSNANNLALAAAALGVDTYKHAQGGWKVTKDSVDKLIPDLKESLSTVPPDTPVVADAAGGAGLDSGADTNCPLFLE
jgi:hypothetical protein